jgi:hypothetical protein
MVTPAENNILQLFLQEDEKRKEVAANNDWFNAMAKWVMDTRALFPTYFDGSAVETWQPSYRIRVLSLIHPDTPVVPVTAVAAPLATAATGTVASQSTPQEQGHSQRSEEVLPIASANQTRPRAEARRANEGVAELAQSVLEAANGPLHINELVQQMKAEGWLGFPEAGGQWEESRQLYRILQGRPTVFKKLPDARNMWALVKDDPSPAQPTLEDDMT